MPTLNNDNTPGMNAVMQGPNTGIPMLDAILGNSASTVAALTGNMNIKFIPQAGPGMSMREAFLARDINTPMWRTMREQMGYQYGSTFGQSIAQVGIATGVNRMMNMSADQFTRELVNAGSSPMGRAAMEFMMEQPAMQQALGGNPFAVADSMFAQRQMLGNAPGGPLLDPFNIMNQRDFAMNASSKMLALGRAAYSGPMGMSATLNPNVTQGYNFEEFAYMGMRAAHSGLPGMRGMGVSDDQFVGGTMQTARIMSALRAGMPGSDIMQQMNMFDTLAGPQGWKRDPSGAEAAVYQINAASRLLGGNVLNTTAATAQFYRDRGFDVGISPAYETAMRSHVIAGVTGGNPAEIAERHAVMMYTGLKSAQGGDAMAMEWIRQSIIGDPSKGGGQAATIYNNWQNAVAHGDKQEQAQWVNRMYSTYGRGMQEVLANPVSRGALFSDVLVVGSQLNVMRNIEVGQRKEFVERTREVIVGNMAGTVSAMEAATGRGYQDTSNEYVESIRTQLKAKPELAGAVGHIEQVLSGIKDPVERRTRLEGLLNANPDLKAIAPSLRRNANIESLNARYTLAAGGDVRTPAQVAYLRASSAEHNAALNDVWAKARAAGTDPIAAQKAYVEQQLAGGTSELRTALGGVGDAAVRQQGERAARNEADRMALTTSYAASQLSTGVTRASFSILSDLVSGKIPEGDVSRLVKENPLLSGLKEEDRDKIAADLKSGDSKKIEAVRTRFMSSQMITQLGELSAAGRLGVGGQYKTLLEAAGSIEKTKEAQATIDEMAANDAAFEDKWRRGTTTGIQGAMMALDEKQKPLEAVLRGFSVEAMTKGKWTPSAGGGGAGATRITGTLQLIDGYANIDAFSQ